MPPRRQTGSFQKSSQRQGGPPKSLPKNLDWLPSVSRSGGTSGGDGDSLTQYAVQETYRRWIDEKLLEYEQECKTSTPEHTQLSREDIIRRFRKLREGLMASNRDDAFATEVYETSLFLAAAYGIPEQVTAVAAQILPPTVISSIPLSVDTGREPVIREVTLFLILVHHLLLATRSASSLQWIVIAISHPFVARNLSCLRLQWLKQIKTAWRTGNYHAIWDSTSTKTVDDLLDGLLSPGLNGRRQKTAIVAEIEVFRHHVREIAWRITAAAYREESESWLLCSLSLSPGEATWISEKQKSQETLLVPGEKRRWRLFKAKAPA